MLARFNWAFTQALWNTIAWTLMVAVGTACFADAETLNLPGLAFSLCAIVLPVYIRYTHFNAMYNVTTVHSKIRDVDILIGHRDAFRRFYSRKTDVVKTPIEYKFVLFLDNDMMIVAKTESQLIMAYSVLREAWVFHKLVNNRLTVQGVLGEDGFPEIIHDA